MTKFSKGLKTDSKPRLLLSRVEREVERKKVGGKIELKEADDRSRSANYILRDGKIGKDAAAVNHRVQYTLRPAGGEIIICFLCTLWRVSSNQT